MSGANIFSKAFGLINFGTVIAHNKIKHQKMY